MKTQIQIASCALAIKATPGSNEIQLLPAGEFCASDGRPACGTWKIDAVSAALVIERLSRRKTPIVIDYEHQTLHKEKNGRPAPAAGRFMGSDVVWRDGDGLFATNVKWTARASEMIDAEEYLYISPVICYDKNTGVVIDIAHAGLTNDPAIDGMEAVALAAASRLFTTKENEDTQMDELLKLLRKILGLADATEEEILTALQALADTLPQEGELANAGLSKIIAHDKTRIEALTAAVNNAAKNNTPDPAQFVPIAIVNELRTALAALTNKNTDNELNTIIQDALTAGKLLPSMEAWAKELGGKDINQLKTFISQSPEIAALTTEQSGNKPPTLSHGLDATELEAAKLLSLTPEEYAKLK
ncbi:phage protease [Citrobacter braakii]|uniref:phage protease n=1 Tax=Citrobacter braakii TaxID=57706 RepID=UPI00352667C9